MIVKEQWKNGWMLKGAVTFSEHVTQRKGSDPGRLLRMVNFVVRSSRQEDDLVVAFLGGGEGCVGLEEVHG